MYFFSSFSFYFEIFACYLFLFYFFFSFVSFDFLCYVFCCCWWIVLVVCLAKVAGKPKMPGGMKKWKFLRWFVPFWLHFIISMAIQSTNQLMRWPVFVVIRFFFSSAIFDIDKIFFFSSAIFVLIFFCFVCLSWFPKKNMADEQKEREKQRESNRKNLEADLHTGELVKELTKFGSKVRDAITQIGDFKCNEQNNW